MAGIRAGNGGNAIPSFFLYGEPPRPDGRVFLHVEPLAIRSQAAGWTIRPHAHQTLGQIFMLARGGGTVLVDGDEREVRAPALLVIPPGAIHGFTWIEGSSGHVLTLGTDVIGMLAAKSPELGDLFERPAQPPLVRAADRRRLDMLLRLLAVELAWRAPAHAASVEALLTLVLVLGLRAVSDRAAPPQAAGRDQTVVTQFRALVERRFRDQARLSDYLSLLGVSERRLRVACARVAHRRPLQIIQDRAMLEARRMLLGSDRSAAEIAYALGFTDPAYFSRVFRAASGMTTREFRRVTGEMSSGGTSDRVDGSDAIPQ